MAYRLRVAEHAEELLDDLVYYLNFPLKNDQAAVHLFDEIEKIYVRLEENSCQVLKSRDVYLNRLVYLEAVLIYMDYVIVCRIEEDLVYVLGIFHQLENYRRKIKTKTSVMQMINKRSFENGRLLYVIEFILKPRIIND